MFTTEYSVSLNHENDITSTHKFEYMEYMEIFVNITGSEAFVPFWGLESFSDLETEINQVFTRYYDSFSRWESTLEKWRGDYLSAWSDFVFELEREEFEDEMGDQREEDYHEYLVSSAGF